MSACRSHPKFVLERHVGRYDMLKPGSQKVGFHRGEAFYLREDLTHLHTVSSCTADSRSLLAAEQLFAHRSHSMPEIKEPCPP